MTDNRAEGEFITSTRRVNLEGIREEEVDFKTDTTHRGESGGLHKDEGGGRAVEPLPGRHLHL